MCTIKSDDQLDLRSLYRVRERWVMRRTAKVNQIRSFKGLGRVYFGVGDYAHLGVLVFLVISGFLITRLLLVEHEKTGRVSRDP